METEEVRLHHPETLLSYKSHWGITARIYIRRRMPLVILPSHLSALFFIASFCSFYRLMEIFMDTWELNRAAPSARRLNGGFFPVMMRHRNSLLPWICQSIHLCVPATLYHAGYVTPSICASPQVKCAIFISPSICASPQLFHMLQLFVHSSVRLVSVLHCVGASLLPCFLASLFSCVHGSLRPCYLISVLACD